MEDEKLFHSQRCVELHSVGVAGGVMVDKMSISKLVEAAESVCKSLEHPDESVNALQTWALRDALNALSPLSSNELVEAIDAALAQTTATQAAVAAAMRGCAEICKTYEHSVIPRINDNGRYEAMMRASDAILAAIPIKANTALEALLLDAMKQALDAYDQTYAFGYRPDLKIIVDGVVSKRIVDTSTTHKG